MPTVRLPPRPAHSVSTEEIIVGEHLAELRGRIRLLTWVSGLCQVVLVLFGGWLVTGTLDWLMHFDESGLRLVIALGLVGGSGWMIWRHLIAPLCQPLTGTFLAARVERRFPGLKNRVMSAVEFLEHRLDTRLGSAELQQAVVGQALQDLARIEASDVVETKAVRNVMIGAGVVCALAATVVLLHPLEAATSVQRLMFPFAKVPWPRAVELQLVRSDFSPVVQAPDRPLLIARGDTLELYVENTRGRLPERVWFESRTGENGLPVREALRQTTLRDEKGRAREAAVISWVAVRGTMQFRATGGDDSVMPYLQVEVVPPPNIESLQVTVTPPPYSGRPVEVLPPGVGHVQGLLGTKVSVVATSDKVLASARLRVGEQPAVSLPLHADGRQFTAAFEIKEAVASSYWFELTDAEGFIDREAVRYELRGIADGVPEVTIEFPVADVLLTADAELPVKILAKDDLGLVDVRITYQVGDDEATHVIPLFQHTTVAQEDQPADDDDVGRGNLKQVPPRHEADHLWKMAELKPEPGTRIIFRGEATDAYDLGQPHLGKSIPRTITIVSREEKQKELAGRVGELLEDLQQAAQLQQRARQQTQELQTQLDKVGELRPQDLDQLQRTELDQRQTASRLTHPADGVETQARQLLEEFRANLLDDAGTEQRLERLTSELGRLEREELPEAERALTRAQKLAEAEHREDAGSKPATTSAATPSQKSDGTPGKTDPPGEQASKPVGDAAASEEATDPKPSPKPAEGSEGTDVPREKPNGPEAPGDKPEESSAQGEKSSEGSRSEEKAPSATRKSLDAALAEAEQQQSRSLESLQDLQQLLSEWRDRRDVARDLTSVIAEQEQVQQDAAEMAQQTMTKSSAELTQQEKAELNKLAARQRKVAEELDQFRKQLDQAAGSLQKNDPDAAGRFNEVGQELSKQATASKLEDAAQSIAENKMGNAAQVQQQAMDELHDVERMMKRQPNEDTEQFLKQTEEVQQEFRQLKDEQQNLADQAEDLAKQPDSPAKKEQIDELMKQQEDLTERMAKAERKLERLRLRGPAEAAHRARKRMTEMMKDLQEGGDDEQMQQAMDEALDDLEQVERELVLEKRIAQERLAFEQLEKIEDELKSLRSRQAAVVAETQRLDDARAEGGTFSRGQLKTLKELAETERSLQHAAEQMQQQMASAEVFALVLKRLGRSLKLAADLLGERETAGPTQTLEQDAIRKIDSLLSVLKQDQKKPEKPAQPPQKPEELSQEPQEQEEKPEEAQPPGDMLPQLAQLKLLKSLQEEYLERTELLNKFRDQDGKLPAAMEAEKQELAREQAELADFARNLVAKFLQQQPDRGDASDPPPKDKGSPKERDPTKIDP